MNKKNIPLICLIIVLLIAVVGLIVFLFRYTKEDEELKDLRGFIINSKEPHSRQQDEKEENQVLKYYLIDGQIVQEKYKDLYMMNPDLIGWITIPDTDIDYPVMYTPDDEEYYIHNSFEKKYSSSGTIFAAADSSFHPASDNILLYGHHMRIGTMFADLLEYENQEWFEKHKFIYFNTLYEDATYEVISAFRTSVGDEQEGDFLYYAFFDAEDESEYNDFINNVKQLSVISSNTSAVLGDGLLTLSTCAYHSSEGRFVVVAKRVDGTEVQEGVGLID